MRLISWNCQGAFRKKLQHIGELRPDILVVQECEKVVVDPGGLFDEAPSSSLVMPPDTVHKGLGVFTFGDWKAEMAPFYEPDYGVFLPLLVSGPLDFLLIAVWAWRTRGTYAETFCRAAECYKPEMEARPTIWAGDFNNNVCADKPTDKFNFSMGLKVLHALGIRSVNHHDRGIEYGDPAEEATWFRGRKADMCGQLDYVFASEELLRAEHSIEIGKSEFWLQHSDHMPLIFDVSVESPAGRGGGTE